MKKILTLIAFLFCVQSLVFAQSDFSIENQQAFETKLEEMGFLQALKVKEIKQADGIYYLRLQFLSDNPEESNSAWAALTQAFAKEKEIPLTEYFYFLFINSFQIADPQNVLLEIRQSYLSETCPFIRYYFDDSKNDFQLIESFCKANISETIKLKELSLLTEKQVLANKETSKEVIYEKLLSRFKEIYNKQKGFEKKSEPVFVPKYRKGNSSLVFEVKNLQKEVLTEAGENFVYSMLTFLTGEKYLPYEHLKFTITYNLDKQEMQVHLEARYGSGLHGNKDWGGMTDMDKGFPDFINTYLKEKIMPEIIRTITNDTDYGKN